MGRNTTERVALTPETKAYLDEQKPDGMDFDVFIKLSVKHSPGIDELLDAHREDH